MHLTILQGANIALSIDEGCINCYYLLMMNLKEIRLNSGITQQEASKLLGVSLRSYKDYENNESKVDTLKYKYMVSELNRLFLVDENHGVLSVEKIKRIVKAIFDKYDVRYCYLFGSYATNEANEKSDVDLLVATSVTGMYFYGLAEELREALHKKVDLLNLEQLTNNPTLIDEILMKGIRIYAKE